MRPIVVFIPFALNKVALNLLKFIDLKNGIITF